MPLLVAIALLAGSPVDDDARSFQAAARVMSLHCLRCHNAETTRGGFDLSTRKAALLGGATADALVPGKPEESPLLSRPSEGSMPPEKDGRRLTASELAALSDWISRGAPWSDDVSLPLPTPERVSSARAAFQAPPRRPHPHRWRLWQSH
jgi:mono/diheme cytochrome c family protein